MIKVDFQKDIPTRTRQSDSDSVMGLLLDNLIKHLPVQAQQ